MAGGEASAQNVLGRLADIQVLADANSKLGRRSGTARSRSAGQGPDVGQPGINLYRTVSAKESLERKKLIGQVVARMLRLGTEELRSIWEYAQTLPTERDKTEDKE